MIEVLSGERVRGCHARSDDASIQFVDGRRPYEAAASSAVELTSRPHFDAITWKDGKHDVARHANRRISPTDDPLQRSVPIDARRNNRIPVATGNFEEG